MKEAKFYNTDGRIVSCFLCNHFCKIFPNNVGFCNVRKNIDGKLYSLVYGKPVALAIDPIEKKPFYHFLPGSKALSFGTVGCNFRCRYCQNWDISQSSEIYGKDVSVERIKFFSSYADGIAYTYNEPTIFIEYALDIINACPDKYHVFVSNGYMSKPACMELKNKLDAIRIDLKAFSQKTYDKITPRVEFEQVLENIKLFSKSMHIELINLVIPGINDNIDEVRAMVRWIKSVSKDIPLHFIAFYPAYKMMDYPPTPLSTLLKLREIALEEGLRYVYTGNKSHKESESTYCYNCGNLLVERDGFRLGNVSLDDGKCPYCGAKQNFVLDLHKYRERA